MGFELTRARASYQSGLDAGFEGFTNPSEAQSCRFVHRYSDAVYRRLRRRCEALTSARS
jgi:hypothetical protein